ncbi:MAG: hypothetical protein OEQ39_03110 [Gammaproteobacteria bacterium]|nr:hypothetical protein [Gammaproteobacteria bacterium]MDH3464643.1 hypothetical protein [Gammaproteobacteria bacterium]
MSTGSFENWAGNILEIGPIYPFVGSEFILFLAGMAFWIAWQIWQIGLEKRTYNQEKQQFGNAEVLRKIVGAEDPKNP